MITRKIRRYAAIGTVTAVLIVVVSAASKAFSNLEFSYPAAPVSAETQLVADRSNLSSEELGVTCQPEGATDLELVAEAAGEHEVFQIWQMNIDGQLVERTTTLFGTACGLANDSRYIQVPYENVPEEIAETIAVQSLQHDIEERGGLGAYRADLIEGLQPDGMGAGRLPRFSSIDVKAWEEVGLTVPANLYEIIQFEESEPYGS